MPNWSSVLDDLRTLERRLNGMIESLAAGTDGDLDAYAPDVEAAYERIKAGIGMSQDVLLRRILVPACGRETVLVACIDGMSDTQMVDQGIIRRLVTTTIPPQQWDRTVLTPANITHQDRWPAILAALATGSTLIVAPGLPFVWVVDTAQYPQRAIGRPQTEMSVRGPEEAFTEVLLTQKTQIRRNLPTPALRFVDVTVGFSVATKVSVVYIDGLTNPALVESCLDRLRAVQVSGISTASQIAGLIRDHPRSIFPTIRATERVDLVKWRLLQGGVAILTNGDPFVLLAPAPLVEFYRTAMDLSSSWVDTSFVRIIRFVGWLFGLYLPAVYVAFTGVNPSLLPQRFWIVMQGNHAGLPFSPVVEIVLMILVIEILRESAIRLPQVLGSTIGTVGAIVVGTAVVRAGIVDPQVIVLMTLTALSLFSTPVYELTGAWRIVNILLLFGAWLFGVFGLVLVTMGLLAVVIDMQSFGVPYFAPWAPFRVTEWSDALIRAPWTLVQRRWVMSRPHESIWRVPKIPAPRPHLAKSQREDVETWRR